MPVPKAIDTAAIQRQSLKGVPVIEANTGGNGSGKGILDFLGQVAEVGVGVVGAVKGNKGATEPKPPGSAATAGYKMSPALLIGAGVLVLVILFVAFRRK